MTIRKLEIYYTVSEMLSMTEAAKVLYISQPSISQVIKELEEEIGVKLFERLGRKLYITEEGKLFQKYALRMLNLYKESQKVMEDIREVRSGNLRVGASTTIGTYLLPDIIADFKQIYPQVNIELYITNTQEISESILKNNIDIGLIEGKITANELEIMDLWEDELIIISSPNKKWKKIIDRKKLEKETFILREKGSGTRDTYEDAIGIREQNIFVFGGTEAIKRAVIKDLGVACVSSLTIKEEEKRKEIIVSKIKNLEIKRDLKLIYHKDKEFSKLIEKFIDFSKQYNISKI